MYFSRIIFHKCLLVPPQRRISNTYSCSNIQCCLAAAPPSIEYMQYICSWTEWNYSLVLENYNYLLHSPRLFLSHVHPFGPVLSACSLQGVQRGYRYRYWSFNWTEGTASRRYSASKLYHVSPDILVKQKNMWCSKHCRGRESAPGPLEAKMETDDYEWHCSSLLWPTCVLVRAYNFEVARVQRSKTWAQYWMSEIGCQYSFYLPIGLILKIVKLSFINGFAPL